MNSVWRYKIGKYSYFITLFFFLLTLALTKFSSKASNVMFVLLLIIFFIGTVLLSIGAVKISLGSALQLCFILFPITLFWILTLRKNIIHKMPYHPAIAYTGCVVLILSTALILRRILHNFQYTQTKYKVIKYMKENYYIFPIMIVYVICYIPCFFLLFKSDSNTYYLSVVQNQGGWDFTLNDLSCFKMGYHLTYGYSIYAFLGNYLWRPWGIGIRLVNLIFVFINVYCINDIIKYFFPKGTKFFKAILICLFVFNPLFLGIIQELNIDMPLTCFFIWFIWAFIYKKPIYTVFFSCLLCFSKEIGIILLAGFVLGTFFWRLICKRKKICFKAILHCYNYYEWLISYGPILFIINMLFLNNKWGEKNVSVPKQIGLVNSVQINPEYMFIKAQQMFILNFQWIIIPLLLSFFVVLLVRKKKVKINEITAGIVCSFLFFLTFQLLYFTYPHYRYLQVNAFYFMLSIAGITAYIFSTDTAKNLSCSLIALLFFVQSFYSIDIFSNSIFRSISIGDGKILSLAYYCDAPNSPYVLWSEKQGADLSNEKFRDYVQNNRQYLGFEYCFEKLLTEISYDETDALLLSPIYSDSYWGNETWTIVNMFGVYDKTLLHWNPYWKQITYEPNDLPLNFTTVDMVRSNPSEYDRVWFIELPYETTYNTFPENCIITDKITTRYFNWFLNAYKIEIPKD